MRLSYTYLQVRTEKAILMINLGLLINFVDWFAADGVPGEAEISDSIAKYRKHLNRFSETIRRRYYTKELLASGNVIIETGEKK